MHHDLGHCRSEPSRPQVLGEFCSPYASNADEKSIRVVAHQETNSITWLYRIVFDEYIPKFYRLDLVGLDRL